MPFSKFQQSLAESMTSLRSILLVTVIMITVMSLLMVASASIPYAQSKNLSDLHYFIRQLVYVVIGGVGCFLLTKVPLRYLFSLNLHMFLLGFCLLAIVFTILFTESINGSKRWISFAGINFQPAELVKFAVVLYTASFLVRRSNEIRYSWIGFLRLVVIIGAVGICLMKQPDFGSTMIVIITAFIMMFVGGMPKRQFFVMLGIIATMAFFAITLSPYRFERVLSFRNPFDDLQDTDYQLGRSLVAFARGDFSGVGFSQSVQKMSHLPEAHTDFLLAVTGEELGFVGVAFLLILQTILLITIMKVSLDALKRRQHKIGYLAFGIGILLFGQIFVNAGMNMGLLPTKGLTMPFYSFGGSSMVINLMMIGILLRIIDESPKIYVKDSRYY